MEAALAILLVSSLSVAGLLSLWAATSGRHWFLRTAVFLGALSPLLLIPAHEPLLIFLIQGMVAACGISACRYLLKRRNRAVSSRLGFSLATLMQVALLVAISAAVAVRLPDLNARAWQSIVLVGAITGLVTLISYWIVFDTLVRWWIRLPAGVVLLATLAFALAFGDWFFAGVLTGYWPPPDDTFVLSMMGAGIGYSENDFVWIWLPIAMGIGVALVVVQRLLVLALAPARVNCTNRSRLFWKLTLSFLVVVLVSPAACAYWLLMNPLPIPEQSPPEPNGYAELRAAWEIAEQWKFDQSGADYETVAREELAKAVGDMEQAYALVESGLEKQVWRPLDYASGIETMLPSIQAQRAMVRAMAARSHLAKIDGRWQDASRDSVNAIRFGYAIRHNGLMIQDMVGIACSGIGAYSLFDMRKHLDAAQCAAIVHRLASLDASREPMEGIIYRDRVWTQHGSAWYGHLYQILQDISGETDDWANSGYLDAYRRDLAILRLLQLELAIQQYRLEQGHAPEDLTELTPEYILQISVDPYAEDGRPLAYRRLPENDYLVYSVGHNGTDDQGIEPTDDEGFSFFGYSHTTGDFRLDTFYKSQSFTGTEPDEDSQSDEPPLEEAQDGQPEAADQDFGE